MVDKITSRAVRGEFQRALAIDMAPSWVNAVSNKFMSDSSEELYAWLGAVPAMREVIGGRNAKELPEYEWTIKNRHFEATLEVLTKDLRRDKIGALRMRIAELATRASTHEASLLSELIVNGETELCYDGQFFFDTDHEEGSSGAQSNDIDVDISGLPVETAGSTTNPSIAEMQFAIAKGVQQITSFVDDQAEPMNETANNFLVMVPQVFLNSAIQAVDSSIQVAETQSVLGALKKKFSINVEPNVRLSDWTTKFAMFRTDAPIKALIRQEETGVMVGSKGDGSEYEFDNFAHQYGIDVWRNAAYGRWQNACLITLT